MWGIIEVCYMSFLLDIECYNFFGNCWNDVGLIMEGGMVCIVEYK